MIERTKNGLSYSQAPWPDAGSGLRHGFFSRRGGVSPSPFASLNAGPSSGDDPENLQRNLERITSALHSHPDALIAARQVHGSDVVAVTREDASRSVFKTRNPFHADALISEHAGIFLGILTADCLPLLFFDPERRAIGAAHAGWRGTRQNIAGRTVRAMAERYATRPGDLWAALGPSIGACCYVVGQEVAETFLSASNANRPHVLREAPDRWRLDLTGINRCQLLEQGLAPEKIHTGARCTKCRSDLFFSVRAQGEPTGRQISLIGMPPSSI